MAHKIHKFEIIWPEKRVLSAEKLMAWAEDAYANGEIDVRPINASEAAEMLHQAGLITLRSP